MERRGQQEMGSNPMGYTPSQESPVKLPLAPIISTPPDHRRPNAIYSARRGSSIFSPTQTLNHPYSPPPHHHHHHHHHHQLSPPLPPPPAPPQSSGGESPDPDPTTLTASGASNPNDPAPPSLPPPPEAPAAANAIRYKECLKNHAASMGGHVVDGCGEFMPGGVDGTPEALRCAACDCHRNFHRKESCGEHPGHHHHNHPVANNISSSSHRQNPSSAPPHLRNQFASPAAMVSFGGDSSSEDLDAFQPGGQAAAGPSLVSGSKKRFRTKFSKDQKERMLEFAGKLGWRVQKQDEVEVQQFCGEVGVKRQVFKVWMHNNKQAMRKRERSE